MPEDYSFEMDFKNGVNETKQGGNVKMIRGDGVMLMMCDIDDG
ncbi:20366_t:CDS:2 [Gigaspora rosea]|nr:20366_t:CDS:2 [Gigaspora rosea]